MLLFRWLILLLLLVAGVAFAYYATTGDPRFTTFAWLLLKWTVLASLGYFAVLIAERVL